MTDMWFCSDHHFSHKNILVFKRPDGVTPLRSFDSPEEHDETIIQNHNKLVKPDDKVYFLGDITFRLNKLALLDRMNGKKRLILGNHDEFGMDKYMPYFEKIQMCMIFKDFNFMATHVPFREDQFRPHNGFNVHGHVHAQTLDSKRHMNICLEERNYSPVHLDEILTWIKTNG